MKQYVDKDALAAWIESQIDNLERNSSCSGIFGEYQMAVYDKLLSFLDTLETKEINTWHLQEKENIYDAVKDWDLYTFACIMKDGTIQKFSGILDEDCEGHIYVHIYGVNDDYDNVDDIIFWIETPNL